MSSARTMAIAQKLYEQGLISYHRTDMLNLSNEAFAQISDYAADHVLPVVTIERTWASAESAQEAHVAIRPADINNTMAGADDGGNGQSSTSKCNPS